MRGWIEVHQSQKRIVFSAGFQLKFHFTLTNGAPIETVSKMLAHRNLKTTQHYAKILDLKVSEDMGVLREKFKKRDKPSERVDLGNQSAGT